MRQNPYLNRVAIQDPAQFYGRKRELAKIFSRLGASRPQSISLVGERKIGKSSLLNYIYSREVRQRYLTSAQNYIFLFLDLQQRRDISLPEFFKSLFAQLKREAGDLELDLPQADFDSVKAVLDNLQQRGRKLIVLFDEFDAITTNNQFNLDFYSFLRSIANNYNVAYVTSSSRDLQELCHTDKIADSPFFNIFTNVYLRAFSRDEAIELIVKPSSEAGIPLSQYIEPILEIAGYFPFYLQVACSAYFEHIDSTGSANRKEIEEAFLDEAAVHFNYTWEHFEPDQRGVIEDFIAGRIVRIERNHICDELKRAGYLIETRNGARLFSSLFARAIEAFKSSPSYAEAVALPPTEFVDYRSADARAEGARSLKRLIEEERRLAHFEIIRMISEGGMGKIYQARDTRLKRTVAIKVLSERFAKNEVVKQRFLREAQTASQLNHPNIATIYETGEAMNVPYIVMEFVKGKNLGEILAKRAFAIDEIISIGIQIASALQEAHENEEKIIHRDIKPGNIMLTDKGQVKVLDFGLAKPSPLGRIVEGSAKNTITEEGMVIGTVRYMSPEQARGKKEIDHRSDIFSLGILLYEIITGSVPFQGENYLDAIEAICGKEPAPIRSLRKDAPEALVRVIEKCLRKEPDERYQSAAEVIAALKSVE